MSAPRSSTPTARWVGVVLALALSACTSPEGDGGPSPSESKSGSTVTTSSTPADTSDDTSGDTSESAGDCERARQRAVVAMKRSAYHAFVRMINALTGHSARASHELRDGAHAAVSRLRVDCGHRTAADQRLLDRVADHTGAPLGPLALEAVEDALVRWAGALGQSDETERLAGALKSCRQLWQRVRGSYRVYWRWSSTGKEWWVLATIDNGTGRALSGTTDGRVRATALLPGQNAYPPGTGILSWGGSSADDLYIPSGVSTLRPWTDAGPMVRTRGEGEMRVLRFSLDLNPPGAPRTSCYRLLAVR